MTMGPPLSPSLAHRRRVGIALSVLSVPLVVALLVTAVSQAIRSLAPKESNSRPMVGPLNAVKAKAWLEPPELLVVRNLQLPPRPV